MPSLPRIKRSRARGPGDVVRRPEPRLAELGANGLTWAHLDSPGKDETEALAARFDWHPLDVEDILSKRQRPKIDEYPDYLFIVLHFPVYDYLVTLPAVQLLPLTRLFERCREDGELRDDLFRKGSGRLLYEVLDD